MRRASGALGLVVVLTIALFSTDVGGIQIGPSPPTPGWDTKANRPNDPNYHMPAYPIAFVKAPLAPESLEPICRDFDTVDGSAACTNLTQAECTDYTDGQGHLHDRQWIQRRQGAEYDYHLGSDVISATNPGVGNELWIYLPPYGQVKKLFPRQVHFDSGKIDFPASVGSVVEPSLSEDGTKIYFSYFHDATEAQGTEVDQFESIPLTGADIYAIDIGPLLSIPAMNPDLLQVTRLTFPGGRDYVGSTREQEPLERVKDAMNPSLATSTTTPKTKYGTVYLHPTEFRTRTGLHLAYASNKRRLANSNNRMLLSNYNLNLHVAPLKSDGTLGPDDNQFQYYTTTSAMSPTPLREGLAFSYQATTDDARYWHIQKLDSEGRWGSLTGYGHGDQLFHLGSFCVGDEGGPGDPTDYFVALKYYNINNESFGSLWKQDLSVLGVNTYTTNAGSGAKVPRQVGATELTLAPHSLSQDIPAPYDLAAGKYYGKFSTPRCGGVNELYFAYTPTSANNKAPDYECNESIYRSHIGFRDNLLPWTPNKPAAQNGHYTVIKRTNDDFNLLWPVPVLPWSGRSNGDATQQHTGNPATKRNAHIDPGEPLAIVGTSALWNTDRRPPECYIPQGGGPNYFHPFGVDEISGGANNLNDQITNNQDLWTRVYAGGFCSMPPPDSILGIAINITSNKTNLHDDIGYETGPASSKETTRLLGVYDVRTQSDQSFKALVPAHVPFEFQALDATYGMKLADVRSWHSLKVRETRTDCGGCHQHQSGAQAEPFAGTYAATHDPEDMVRSTRSIRYDSTCNVQTGTVVTATATEGYPEWSEVWQGLKTYCGSCHTGTGSGTAALSWNPASDGSSAYTAIVYRGFASAQRGALGSQLFWAARGHRTDGRPNDSAQFSADYACAACAGDCNQAPCNSNKHRWGFYYSQEHDYANDPTRTQCEDGVQAYADWVFKLGKWIDNHMPRNKTPGNNAYQADWYHPTADAALNQMDCETTSLRVGWWDDTGSISELWVRVNDQDPPLNANPVLVRPNGTTILQSLPALSASDWITVEVKDAAGNRQVYRKRVDQLVDECETPPHQEQPNPP